MKQHLQRVLWVAAPVVFGVAIGWLWSEARHSSGLVPWPMKPSESL